MSLWRKPFWNFYLRGFRPTRQNQQLLLKTNIEKNNLFYLRRETVTFWQKSSHSSENFNIYKKNLFFAIQNKKRIQNYQTKIEKLDRERDSKPLLLRNLTPVAPHFWLLEAANESAVSLRIMCQLRKKTKIATAELNCFSRWIFQRRTNKGSPMPCLMPCLMQNFSQLSRKTHNISSIFEREEY